LGGFLHSFRPQLYSKPRVTTESSTISSGNRSTRSQDSNNDISHDNNGEEVPTRRFESLYLDAQSRNAKLEAAKKEKEQEESKVSGLLPRIAQCRQRQSIISCFCCFQELKKAPSITSRAQRRQSSERVVDRLMDEAKKKKERQEKRVSN